MYFSLKTLKNQAEKENQFVTFAQNLKKQYYVISF
jgi:hypothetical protein